MGTLIIRGKYILSENGLQEDWSIKIKDNLIDAVGPDAEIIEVEGDKVFQMKDRIIVPGFVNGHMHMYGVLSHGITAEALVTEFSSFLEDFWWPYVEDRLDHELVRITTEWACVEMIKSGITCFADILEGPNSIPGALNIEAEVVRKAGLRGVLSFEACERLSSKNGEAGLIENAEFIKENNFKGSLIQGMMSVHTLFTSSKEFLMKAKNLSDEIGCDIHMHLSESMFEPEWALKNYGKRPIEVYEKMGYLSKRVFASQLVQVDDKELDIFANSGARAVSMPLSNCEVGGGVAPVTKMIERGIKVGLGTDGYINNFFEVMRGAFLIHKAYLRDPQVMPAKLVFEMATSMGAQAMGINSAGSLKVGNLADMIALDLNLPTPINKHNVYDQIILFMNPENVQDVIVNGRFLKRDGKLTTLDEKEIKTKLRDVAKKFWNG